MKTKTIGLLMVVGLLANTGFAAEGKKPEDIDVVSACKGDCSEAKTNAEAHECAERKGKIRPSFKKTKCWEVNEEYEALVHKAPAKGK